MNNRSLENLPLFKGVPWMVVYICEAFLILTGNSITVFIFWSIRKKLKRASYLLINLAVADIVMGISITLFIWDGIAVMEEIALISVMRKMAMVTGNIGQLSSLLSMVLISLERMFAILWPFRHRILNIWFYHVSVSIVWLVAGLYGIIFVSFESQNKTSEFAYRYSITIIAISSVLIITGAYLAIWIAMRCKQMPVKSGSRSMEQERKLAKTLFVVTILSIISYLPAGISVAFGDYLQSFYSLRVRIIITVQIANSFLNPVVYCFKVPEFKESLRKILCRCSRQQLPANTKGITLRSVKSLETL